MSFLNSDPLSPLLSALNSQYGRAAAIGAGAGATGSLAGQLFGFLDLPRQGLYRLLPGFHDDEGNPLTGSQVAGNALDIDPDSLGGRIAGVGLDTVADPLTWLAGPLGSVAGKRGSVAAERIMQANRTAETAGQAISGLTAAEQAAKAAAANVPDYANVLMGGRTIPTEAVASFLGGEGPRALRGLGGASALGSTIKAPPSDFLIHLLERQGYGSRMFDPEGNPTGRLLLAGDPETRSLFSTSGGRLRQVGDVRPEMRGPLHPLYNEQPPAPSLGSVVGTDELDRLGRVSPLLEALMNERGVSHAGLQGLPVDQAGGLLSQALSGEQGQLDALRQSLAGRPLERVLARYLTKNPLGV
jgi:hypothetical protein